MELFRNTNIDFMRLRRVCVALSVVAMVGAVVLIFGLSHLNVGIDFAGGTQLTVKFAERPDIEQLRALLAEAGYPDAGIQRFGDEESNEVMIKTPVIEGSEEGSRAAVVAAFGAAFNPDQRDRADVNELGREALGSYLERLDPDRLAGGDPEAIRDHYGEVARAIIAAREEDGILVSWAPLEATEAVSPAVVAALQENGVLGAFHVLAAENVGPVIGQELRNKGILAVAFSIVGMMAYIWVRFELRFGIGAVVATIHDVLITLACYALAGYEFNLTTIAAFLTVVGYSVNDTVVVFDRVRENLRRTRRDPLEKVLNVSLNQTLSRTVLTSGTTLLAVGSLFVLGGDVIRGLSFVLLVGILVGTYSSIYVASPVVLYWERWFSKSRRSSRAAPGAAKESRGRAA
ncbi:MAG TPA: protein translocase subunit SecF [Thermoanaerobaculia bacterium]|nr:protein translocase subunit SecF [Thermoanaerobaculia bacterium]